MQAHQYAQALSRATAHTDAETTNRIVRTFVALVIERGHASLLPRILHMLEKHERRTRRMTVPLLRVADTAHVDVLRAHISHDAAMLSHTPSSDMRIQVDPSLIGGYELWIRGERVDRSYKRTLIDMYHTLTSPSPHQHTI